MGPPEKGGTVLGWPGFQSWDFDASAAAANPWQFQHCVRFGYAVMPAFNERGWTMKNIIDGLSYVQTLPVD